MDEPNSEIKSQEVEEILRLLACSDLRNNLAKALRNGKKMTLSELGEHVGASSPACVHALRELGKVHVTHQDEKRNYSLTNIGEIVTRKFEELNAAITTLSQNKEFWLDHDLSDIPKHLLDKIGSLADSTVLTSTSHGSLQVFFYALYAASKFQGDTRHLPDFRRRYDGPVCQTGRQEHRHRTHFYARRTGRNTKIGG